MKVMSKVEIPLFVGPQLVVADQNVEASEIEDSPLGKLVLKEYQASYDNYSAEVVEELHHHVLS